MISYICHPYLTYHFAKSWIFICGGSLTGPETASASVHDPKGRHNASHKLYLSSNIHQFKYRNITEMLLFVGNALYDVTREEWWGNFLHGVNSGSSVTVLFLKPRLVTKTKRMVNVITRAGAIVKSKTVPKRTFGPRKIYGRYRGGVIRKKVGRPFLMRNIQLIGYIVSNLSWKWIEKFS